MPTGLPLNSSSELSLYVIFEPVDFIAKLAALVPKPRVNLTISRCIRPEQQTQSMGDTSQAGQGQSESRRRSGRENTRATACGHDVGAKAQAMGWTPPHPNRHRCAKLRLRFQLTIKKESTMEISRVGVDLAKNVFQLHSADSKGKTVWKRHLSRSRGQSS